MPPSKTATIDPDASNMTAIRHDLDVLLRAKGKPGSFASLLQRWQGIIALATLVVGGVVFHTQALNRIDANTAAVGELVSLQETVDTIERNMITTADLDRAIELHTKHPHPTAVSLEQMEFLREDLSEIKVSLRDLSVRQLELEASP